MVLLLVHSLHTGDVIAWDQAMIDDREVNWHRRRIKDPAMSSKDEPRPRNHLKTILEMFLHFLYCSLTVENHVKGNLYETRCL